MFSGQRLRCLAAACGMSLGAAAPAHMSPLRGQYGFLSVFSGISDDEARSRVRDMVTLDIKEYEFYNACGGYSAPPAGDEKSWGGPFGVVIDRSLVLAYTDEVAKNGGRSWLHVQMQATDHGDTALQSGATVLDPYKVNGKPLLDLVVPNAAWATTIAPRWAAFAKSLGFQGIHWSTFGNWGDSADKGADVHGFLKASLEVLAQHGLGQTCNFVDGFGWDARIQTESLVAFNYWVVWEVPKTEDAYFESHVAPFHGVYVAWPGTSAEHTDETWNSLVVGMTPFEVLKMRWLKAKNYNSSYLAVGDGLRRLQNDFYPNSVPLTDDEVEIIRTKITCQPCGITTSTTTAAPPLLPFHDGNAPSEADCERVDTKRGELQITPGSKDMVLSLTSHETALEEVIKEKRGACWVEIEDYVTVKDADGAQQVVAKFQLGAPAESVTQRRLQHLRDDAEEGSGGPPSRRAAEVGTTDATEEVQAVLDPTAPYDPKVEHADVVILPDRKSSGGGESMPWFYILGTMVSALACCGCYYLWAGNYLCGPWKCDHNLLESDGREPPLSNTPGSETRHQEAPLGDPEV